MGYQKLLELAIKTGKALQSKETRLLHHYYGKKEQPVDQTVPFYENLLFCLALCRTKTVEGVQEAKALLERLLAYQGPEGLFPVYLHEFPFYHDRFCGAHLLPVFYWIDHLFHGVLGISLKQPIDRLAETTLKELPRMAFAEKVKAAGALISLGKLEKEAFPKETPDADPKEIADWITGRRLAGLAEPDYNFWNFPMEAYFGPWKSIRFEEGRPELTLLDLYAACHAEEMPERLTGLHPVFLQGALCVPQESVKKKVQESKGWFHQVLEQEGYAYDSYPFYIRWGKQGESLALHPGTLQKVTECPGYVEIELGKTPPLEERDGCKEIQLSLLDTEGLVVKVNGIPATVFRIGDEVTLEGADFVIRLRFATQGKGVFLGHVSKGNRPSEWVNSGENRFKGYHRLLSLRTIEREEGEKVHLHWQFEWINQ